MIKYMKWSDKGRNWRKPALLKDGDGWHESYGNDHSVLFTKA
jgi:hypothetical protein